MKRLWSGLFLAAAVASACVNVSDSGQQFFFTVAPILDSVFVGDTLPARSVYLDDGAGHHSDPGPFTWSISPQSVATVDATTGKIVGVSKGNALVIATRTDGVATGAVIIVSRPLEMTLQLDTIVLMPDDTITVPLATTHETVSPLPSDSLKFDSSATPGVYTIDTLTGRIKAVGTGQAPYVARLTNGAVTVVDTGAVVVMTLTDTAEAGRSFQTIFGTAVRHQQGVAVAHNYLRLNPDSTAFQLADTVYQQPASGAIHEKVVITLPDSAGGTGVFEIDSISPQQVGTTINQLNPICQPKFPWAFWQSILPTPGIVAYSHGTASDSVAGYLAITKFTPALVSGGTILGGRYVFRAQRADLYGDPLGTETVRGTFVAPLRTDQNSCGN